MTTPGDSIAKCGVRDWYYRNCLDPEARRLLPDLAPRVYKVWNDPDSTEADFEALYREIYDPSRKIDSKTFDDWPKQSETARRLNISRMRVKRAIEAGELQTNRQTGRACRVNPASILDYCDLHGIGYDAADNQPDPTPEEIRARAEEAQLRGPDL